jgi:hypothetical protein
VVPRRKPSTGPRPLPVHFLLATSQTAKDRLEIRQTASSYCRARTRPRLKHATNLPAAAGKSSTNVSSPNRVRHPIAICNASRVAWSHRRIPPKRRINWASNFQQSDKWRRHRKRCYSYDRGTWRLLGATVWKELPTRARMR